MDRKEYLKLWREKNRDKLRQKDKEYYHKDVDKARERKNKAYDPQKAWERKLIREYGITANDYDLMLKNQEYKCACCGILFSEAPATKTGSRLLCIDHCHSTGKVRSLLCRRCNLVVGLLNEDIETTSNILEYVKHCVRTKEAAKRSG